MWSSVSCATDTNLLLQFASWNIIIVTNSQQNRRGWTTYANTVCSLGEVYIKFFVWDLYDNHKSSSWSPFPSVLGHFIITKSLYIKDLYNNYFLIWFLKYMLGENAWWKCLIKRLWNACWKYYIKFLNKKGCWKHWITMLDEKA